ncbi:hypothetical protein ACHHYP_13472 [Achlya hypogyna]|uniref:Endonuclease/exonuclease/phosphatase domain-containing protein n=1 Tax=Achlya hypogyna TaxID=1202772 RepID=A0A1V9YF79_ACHHY|nr:hypothetical protein ACHHYP_13472 [Achlya hypogyna]
MDTSLDHAPEAPSRTVEPQQGMNDLGHIVQAIEIPDVIPFYRPTSQPISTDNPFALLDDADDTVDDDEMDGTFLASLRFRYTVASAKPSSKRRKTKANTELEREADVLLAALQANQGLSHAAAAINKSHELCSKVLRRYESMVQTLGATWALQRLAARNAPEVPEHEYLDALEAQLETSDPIAVLEKCVPNIQDRHILVAIADFDLLLKLQGPRFYDNNAWLTWLTKNNLTRRKNRSAMLTDHTLLTLLQSTELHQWMARPRAPPEYYKTAANWLLQRVNQHHPNSLCSAATLEVTMMVNANTSDCRHADTPTKLPPLSIISLNNNNITQKVAYIRRTFSQSHDHFIRKLASPTFILKKPPHVFGPESPTPLAIGSVNRLAFPRPHLATTVHPKSSLRDLVVIDDYEASVLNHRYLLVRGRLADRVVYLHNVYAPAEASERPAFFDALPRDFDVNDLHLVGGDFNVTLDDAIDALVPSSDKRRGRHELRCWLAALDVVDIYRQVHPAHRSFTCPTGTTRLDYIFISSQFTAAPFINARHIHDTTRSDHSAVAVHLEDTLTVGKGPWRTPPWLLELPEAITAVNDHLDDFLAKVSPDEDVGRMYDDMIFSLRSTLKLLHEERVAADHARLKELKLQLAQAVYDLQHHPSGVLVLHIQHIKAELKQYHAARSTLKAEERMQKFLAESSR